MCGIVGFITEEKTIGAVERKRWFINALRTDVVRGDDGTGIFLVEHDQKEGQAADWCKMGAPADQFLATEHAIERLGPGMAFDDYRAVIGHNRAATRGSVSTQNSHPFQEGPITLVHNGTLNSTHNLPTSKSKLKDVDVDSHMICHNLATHSVADVVKELDGAYVLVWHDARDQSVNIIRNNDRPLHILPLKHHKTLLLASEAEMLWWLTKRSNFTPGDKIFYPEPGHWLKFTPEGGVKPKVQKLEMYRYRYRGNGATNYSGGYRNWDYDDDANWMRGAGATGYNHGHRPVINLPTVPARTEGSNMGKAPRPTLEGPAINRAALNRKIPKPLSKTLDLVGLHHLDKLRMSVVQVQEIHGSSSALVIGRLVDLDGTPTAHLYGLTYKEVKAAEGKEMWTVAPCGVKVMGSYGIQVVLVRLLARSCAITAQMPTAPPSSPSSQEGSSTDDPYADCTIEEIDERDLWEAMTAEEQRAWLEKQTYFDASGRRISLSQWYAVTACGCSLCKGQIEPEDSFDMVWDTETKLPICANCRTDLEEDDLIDYASAN